MADVANSAPLHDVGKIMVSDTILNKKGRLTEEEYAAIPEKFAHYRQRYERGEYRRYDQRYPSPQDAHHQSSWRWLC